MYVGDCEDEQTWLLYDVFHLIVLLLIVTFHVISPQGCPFASVTHSHKVKNMQTQQGYDNWNRCEHFIHILH